MARKVEVDRRVRRSKAAVLETTLDLLTQEGMAGFSIDEVSARSGVAKTTVYRHWPSRAMLLLDACATMGGSDFEIGDSGSFRTDLLNLASELRSRFQDKRASIIPSIMDAAGRDSEMAALFQAISEKILESFQLIIDRAVKRKEIRRGTSAGELAASIVGPLVFRRWFSRSPLSDAFIKKVVDRAIAL